MAIPTEPIGSIPRPKELIEGVEAFEAGDLSGGELDELYEDALRDTIHRFEATGSPVVSDGEQTKPSFATYPLHGLEALAPEGVEIPFEDGHVRQLPRLVAGPFHYANYAHQYLKVAKGLATLPVKQAVISASALSLIYPQEGLEGYPQEQFLADLVGEAERDIRTCLDAGAYNVQIDFTEARLSLKLDPSGGLLRQFIDLNNQVLSRFSDAERQRLGVHTCPGGDLDSTHSADVDYADLLPTLFELKADNFYVQMASEPDKARVLEVIKPFATGSRRIFIGVIDVLDPRVESAETVRDRVLEAAEFIPVENLGTTDDCGFSPFGDDTSTSRDTAFEKIRARVEGTRLAGDKLGV